MNSIKKVGIPEKPSTSMLTKVDKYQKIKSFLNIKNHKEAIKVCYRILALESNDEYALKFLFKAYTMKGDLVNTLAVLIKIRQAGYFDANFHTALIKTLTKLCKLEEAKKELVLLKKISDVDVLDLETNLLIDTACIDEAAKLMKGHYLKGNKTPFIMNKYASILHNLGKKEETIKILLELYKEHPDSTSLYWGLANIKSYSLEEEQIKSAIRLVKIKKNLPEEAMHLHYALGKHFEDVKDFAQSFKHYKAANDCQRAFQPHDTNYLQVLFTSLKQSITPDFFNDRKGWGISDVNPIFIVGLPRSGTTLMEQILSSHSQVEAIGELPNMIAYARQIAMHEDTNPPNFFDKYTENLFCLSKDEVQEWAQCYLNDIKIRRNGLPIFIDKMPSNFWHIPFIKIMFPNAKIISMHRSPLSSGFSIFKQCLPRGHSYSNGLESMGESYRYFSELMALFNHVIPGQILTVHYENLVEQTDVYINRVLSFCELDFEKNCLLFHKNQRAIRTPSSEQVRQPIYNSAVEQWKNYEPYLEDMKLKTPDLVESYEKERQSYLL